MLDVFNTIINSAIAIPIAGLLLAIVGIYLTIKYRRRLKVSFANESCLAIFNDISKNIANINISYKGEPLKSNLLLFKGTIVNNGKNDIDESVVHEELKLLLPNNYSWEQFKITNKSKDLSIESEKITNNKVVIKWALFKKYEFFSFSALLKVPEDLDLDQNIKQKINKVLKFKFRITDLDKIHKGTTESVITKKNWYGEWIIGLIALFFIAWLGVVMLFPSSKDVEISSSNISYQSEVDSNVVDVIFYRSPEREMIVKDSNSNILAKGDPEYLVNQYNIKPRVEIVAQTPFRIFISRFIGLILLFLSIVSISLIINVMLNDRRLLKAYQNEQETDNNRS